MGNGHVPCHIRFDSDGTFETINLRQGNFVFGFFMDGEDGQQPVIMGVIGYNNYTAIMAEIPDAKFVPFADLNSSRGQNSFSIC